FHLGDAEIFDRMGSASPIRSPETEHAVRFSGSPSHDRRCGVLVSASGQRLGRAHVRLRRRDVRQLCAGASQRAATRAPWVGGLLRSKETRMNLVKNVLGTLAFAAALGAVLTAQQTVQRSAERRV